MTFIENKGQLNKKVRYYTTSRNSAVYFTDDEIVFDFVCPKKPEENAPTYQDKTGRSNKSKFALPKHIELERQVVRMKLKNANSHKVIEGKIKRNGTVNYFIGNDPARWKTNVPTYDEVYYRSVYAGIDLRVYAQNGALEYDFIVYPGADPSRIAVALEGIEKLEVDSSGDMIIRTALGNMRHKSPHIYQTISSHERIDIPGGFRIFSTSPESTASRRSSEYGFHVASYDKSIPLIIDPLLGSTFIGGSKQDVANVLAVDSAGKYFHCRLYEFKRFPNNFRVLRCVL